jgi:hypothetical protein
MGADGDQSPGYIVKIQQVGTVGECRRSGGRGEPISALGDQSRPATAPGRKGPRPFTGPLPPHALGQRPIATDRPVAYPAGLCTTTGRSACVPNPTSREARDASRSQMHQPQEINNIPTKTGGKFGAACYPPSEAWLTPFRPECRKNVRKTAQNRSPKREARANALCRQALRVVLEENHAKPCHFLPNPAKSCQTMPSPARGSSGQRRQQESKSVRGENRDEREPARSTGNYCCLWTAGSRKSRTPAILTPVGTPCTRGAILCAGRTWTSGSPWKGKCRTSVTVTFFRAAACQQLTRTFVREKRLTVTRAQFQGHGRAPGPSRPTLLLIMDYSNIQG